MIYASDSGCALTLWRCICLARCNVLTTFSVLHQICYICLVGEAFVTLFDLIPLDLHH